MCFGCCDDRNMESNSSWSPDQPSFQNNFMDSVVTSQHTMDNNMFPSSGMTGVDSFHTTGNMVSTSSDNQPTIDSTTCTIGGFSDSTTMSDSCAATSTDMDSSW